MRSSACFFGNKKVTKVTLDGMKKMKKKWKRGTKKNRQIYASSPCLLSPAGRNQFESFLKLVLRYLIENDNIEKRYKRGE